MGNEDERTIERRHKALARCKFGSEVPESSKRRFLRRLIPYEDNLAAK
jgi:hypothetical protein